MIKWLNYPGLRKKNQLFRMKAKFIIKLIISQVIINLYF